MSRRADAAVARLRAAVEAEAGCTRDCIDFCPCHAAIAAADLELDSAEDDAEDDDWLEP